MKSSKPCCKKAQSVPEANNILPSRWSEHLYVELPRADIALFKFILEACDNLAYFSVLDKYRAVIRLTFARETRKAVEECLASAASTVTIRRCYYIREYAMKDNKGLYYYPNPASKQERMYVRMNDGAIEFRLWNSQNPEIWERHGWLDMSIIQRAAAMQQQRGGKAPLEIYDLDSAKFLLKNEK